MAGLFNTYESAVLGQLLGKTAMSEPATYYVALSTTTPAEDGTNITEPGAGAYARIAVTNNTTNFPAPVSGQTSNATAITFPTATATWGVVTHVVLYDAATAGNPWMFAALTASKTIDTDDTPSFPIGSLVFNLD